MMSKEEKALIYNKIAYMALLYGQDQGKQRIVAYVELLAKYDVFSVSAAIDEVVTTCKFFPTIADITEKIVKLNCSFLDPNETANEIINAASKFGDYAPRAAREFLGHEKWEIIENFGGWRSLCSFDDSQKSTVRAQLRDLIKASNTQMAECFKKYASNDIEEIAHETKEINYERQNKLQVANFKNIMET